MQKSLLVKRSIVSDPHLWIAFAATFTFVFLEFLHALGWWPWEVPSNGLLIVILICILMLVGDRLGEGDQVRDNAEKLDRIRNSMLDKRVALRTRPEKMEDYAYLWSGYTGIYRVFNPSYRLDKNMGKDDVVKIFIHRYQNPHFSRAQYLFLTKDESGKASLQFFCELMALVKQQCPNVDKKLEVRELQNSEASSQAEMYLGTRYGEQTAVLELKEPTLDPQHGLPHYYLVVDDKDVVEHYITNHFDPAWDAATDKDIFAPPLLLPK